MSTAQTNKRPSHKKGQAPLKMRAEPLKQKVTMAIHDKAARPKPAKQADVSPTTIKLPQAVRELALEAAKEAGLTMHGFMVDAVAKAAAQSEKRRAFIAEARAAQARIAKTGKTIPSAAVDAFIKARAEGKNPPLPEAISWRK